MNANENHIWGWDPPRMVALSVNKLGDVLVAGGGSATARTRFEQSCAAARRDLIVSHAKMATVTAEERWWKAALALAEELIRTDRLSPRDVSNMLPLWRRAAADEPVWRARNELMLSERALAGWRRLSGRRL